MKHHILCINTGSSSMKFAMYGLGESEELIADGAVERIGVPGGWLWLKDAHGRRLVDRHDHFPAHNDAVKAMFAVAMEKHRLPESDGVGHRLVHGGPKHVAPERVTPELMQTLTNLVSPVPLHLPAS